MNLPLILASASPRRQQLLRQTGIRFEVHPAHIAEDIKPNEPALDYALRLAREKAEAVAQKFLRRFVLGADTIVVLDGQVLGKPADAADAARMLRLLSAREHAVTTAVSLIALDKDGRARIKDTRSCTTQVVFRKLSEDEIQSYITTGEPMDKAGAYAIQGGAKKWVTRTEGDFTNVVGLPMALVMEMLKAHGLA